MTIVRRLFTFMGMKVDKAGFDKADKRADLLKKGVGKIGGAADNVRGKILGMLGAFAGLSAFKGLIQTNVEAQKLGAQLKSVTGSAEKGAAAFDRIKEFAATTPFELNNVTQAYIKLKAAGIEPTADVMKSVGNLAAANSTTIAQAAGAITKANKGLTEELGSQLNITSQTTKDSVKLTVQGVETTVKRGGQNISNFLLDIGRTKFATGMEDQMLTVGGKLSNLSDSVTNFKVKIGEGGLNTAVFNLVDQLINWISANDKLADQIGKKLGVAIDGLGGKMKVLQDNSTAAQVASVGFVGALAVPKVVAFGASLKTMFITIGVGLSAIKLKLVGLRLVLASISPFMIGIAIAVLGLVDLISFFAGGPSLIGKFVESFSGSEGGLGGMADAFLQMKDAVLGIVSTLVDTLAPVIADIVGIVSEIISVLINVIAEVLTPIIEILSIIIQVVLQLVGAVLQIVGFLIKIVVTILKPIIKVVVFIFKIVGFIIKMLGKLIKGILGPIIDVLKSIGGIVAETFDKIFGGWLIIFDAIQEMASRIFAPITEAFDKFINGVKDIIRRLPASLVPDEILLWAGVVIPEKQSGEALAGKIASVRGADALLNQLTGVPGGAAGGQVNMNGNVQVTINSSNDDPTSVAAQARRGTLEGMTDWSSEIANIVSVR